MGRWSSEAFLVYIRPQVLEWTNGLSETMIQINSFTDAHESRPTLQTDPQPSPNIFNGGQISYQCTCITKKEEGENESMKRTREGKRSMVREKKDQIRGIGARFTPGRKSRVRQNCLPLPYYYLNRLTIVCREATKISVTRAATDWFRRKQGTMHSVVTRSGDATVQVRYDATNQPEYRGTGGNATVGQLQ